MRASVLVVAGILGSTGCKDGSNAPPPAPAPVTSRAPTPAGPTPPRAVAADAAIEVRPPVRVDDVRGKLPPIEGDVLAPLAPTADGRQLHAAWCLASTSADAGAHTLASAMTAAGWADVTTRGDAQKAGVSGERDGLRLSLVVTASSATTCAAPTHYLASATVFRTAP